MSENVENVNGKSTKDLVDTIMQVKSDGGPMEALWRVFEKEEHRGVILSDQFRKMLRKAFHMGAWTGFNFMEKILNMPEERAVAMIRTIKQELEAYTGKKPKSDPLFGVDNLEKK